MTANSSFSSSWPFWLSSANHLSAQVQQTSQELFSNNPPHFRKSEICDAVARRRTIRCGTCFHYGPLQLLSATCVECNLPPSSHLLPFHFQEIKKKRPATHTLPPAAADSTATGSSKLVLTSSGWKGEGVAAKAAPLVIPMLQSTFVVGKVRQVLSCYRNVSVNPVVSF
jgi:hypothetical protein